MARTHGRILTSIWQDDDFKRLSSHCQHLYLALVTSPRLSYAGVMDYMPRRIASIAPDLTAAKVERMVATLRVARYVLVDYGTAELLVRTYVRHDNLMHHKNVGKALAAAYWNVESEELQEAIVCELQKAYLDTSTQQGWLGIEEVNPDLFFLAQGLAQANPQALTQAVGM